MKHLNFLSNLLSLSLGSPCTDVSLDRRLTVGSPSGRYCSGLMRLVFILAILLTVGVGDAWGDSSYTLGWGSASGSSGTYTNFDATSGTVTDIVSFSTAKHSEKNTPAYNSGNSELRLYNNKDGSPNYTTDGGSITLTPASGITITGFTITATSGYQPTTKYKVGNGALTTLPAWSSNATSASGLSVNSTSSITIQNCNSSSLQLRIKTIQITYLAPTPCTITWHVNNGTTTAGNPTTNSTTGSKVTTLPTAPTSAACDGSKVFVGWTETPIVGTTNTKPSDLFTTSAGAPTLTQTATHYYAVFANETSNLRDTTVTETFENQTASTTYNSTQNYGPASSVAKIGWTIYYGTVSSTGALKGSKSAQMRWYKNASSNYPYIQDTTQLLSLSNIAFKAKVGKTDVKMDVWYSANGGSWTKVGNGVTFANTDAKDFSYDIPGANATKYRIKIGVSSTSTKPTTDYSSFLVDNVAFTYKIGGITYSNYATSCCTELGTLNGSFF